MGFFPVRGFFYFFALLSLSEVVLNAEKSITPSWKFHLNIYTRGRRYLAKRTGKGSKSVYKANLGTTLSNAFQGYL